MGKSTQRQDCFQMRHGGNLGRKEGAAGVDFGRHGLVLRRQASHRVGDPHAAKPDVVMPVLVIGAVGEAKACQHGKQISAGGIAGERAPGPVGAAKTWRKSHDQETGV